MIIYLYNKPCDTGASVAARHKADGDACTGSGGWWRQYSCLRKHLELSGLTVRDEERMIRNFTPDNHSQQHRLQVR